jgi:hypothetical protein
MTFRRTDERILAIHTALRDALSDTRATHEQIDALANSLTFVAMSVINHADWSHDPPRSRKNKDDKPRQQTLPGSDGYDERNTERNTERDRR